MKRLTWVFPLRVMCLTCAMMVIANGAVAKFATPWWHPLVASFLAGVFIYTEGDR